jgi:hypothetical protein
MAAAVAQLESHPIDIDVLDAGASLELLGHPGLTCALGPVEHHDGVPLPHKPSIPAGWPQFDSRQ